MRDDDALRGCATRVLPRGRRRGLNLASAIAMLAAALVLAAAAPGGTAQAQQPRKPNIVFIMTDDVGWGDLGSYGGGVMRGAPTPNLDRLAAEGMRFVNYSGQASCTAGRASFMTGRIPIRGEVTLAARPRESFNDIEQRFSR